MAVLAGVFACGGRVNRPPPLPSPASSGSKTETLSHDAPPGGWSFHYAVGSSNYRITRIAAIEAPSDSGLRREVSTNTTYESISVETGPGTDTMVVTVVADSFATTTQGRIGSVQPVQLPVKISGVSTEGGFKVEGQAPAARCDPVASTLVSDLRNLLPALPAQLTPGISWSDSIQTSSCQAGIPITVNLRRTFFVSGEARGEGRPSLVILRTDTITARGEGSQLQHRVALQAEGTGRATYHFDPAIGKVVQLTTGQDLNLAFTASSRTTRFRETSQQEFLLR